MKLYPCLLRKQNKQGRREKNLIYAEGMTIKGGAQYPKSGLTKVTINSRLNMPPLVFCVQACFFIGEHSIV